MYRLPTFADCHRRDHLLDRLFAFLLLVAVQFALQLEDLALLAVREVLGVGHFEFGLLIGERNG